MRTFLKKLSIFSVLLVAIFVFSFNQTQAAWVCPTGTIMRCGIQYYSSFYWTDLVNGCPGGQLIYTNTPSTLYAMNICPSCSADGSGNCSASNMPSWNSRGGTDYCYSGSCFWQPDQDTSYGSNLAGIRPSTNFTCTPRNPFRPYRNTNGTDFAYGSCSAGNAGGGCGCGSSGTTCSSGSTSAGHASTAPYRCETKRGTHNSSYPGQYLTACQTSSANGSQCTSGDKCGCDEYGNNCSTSYSATSCTYTTYFDGASASRNSQFDWTADVGTQHGCKVPATNSSYFADSPQKIAGQTDRTAVNEIGGCGTGTWGSPNGCKEQVCVDSPVNHTQASCLKARDGSFKCGGTAGCGENVCENDYTTTGRWGTGSGNGFTTLSRHTNAPVHPTQTSYRVCDLNTPGHASAIQACSITGTTQVGSARLACRCGQNDACGLTSLPNTDFNAQPADLKIASLTLEDPLPANNPNHHVNTYGKHRLKVTFALADKYNAGMDQFGNYGGVSPAARDKAILYTRLIEVCPINLLQGTGLPSSSAFGSPFCVIKRVDGNLSEITETITLNLPTGGPNAPGLPNINKSNISQGPWTVKYRTINDVCNRTFSDAGPTTGQMEYCTGGANCLQTGSNNIVDATFRGITQRGNMAEFNYCNTQIDNRYSGVYGRSVQLNCN